MDQVSKAVNTIGKPLTAGLAAAGISAVMGDAASSSNILGFNVAAPIAVGAVVAAGSLVAEASKNYVIPMIFDNSLLQGLVSIALPLWTGSLAVGVDMLLYGSDATPMATFIAGFGGQLVAEWFSNVSDDIQQVSAFSG